MALAALARYKELSGKSQPGSFNRNHPVLSARTSTIVHKSSHQLHIIQTIHVHPLSKLNKARHGFPCTHLGNALRYALQFPFQFRIGNHRTQPSKGFTTTNRHPQNKHRKSFIRPIRLFYGSLYGRGDVDSFSFQSGGKRSETKATARRFDPRGICFDEK